MDEKFYRYTTREYDVLVTQNCMVEITFEKDGIVAEGIKYKSFQELANHLEEDLKKKGKR